MSDAFDHYSQELSRVIILLLKGVIYAELQPKEWQVILNTQVAIQQYVKVLNLQLLVDEAEGYAFLVPLTIDDEEDASAALPALQPKRPLSYLVSLLCIILRKKLIDQDSEGGSTRVILSHEQLCHEVQSLLPDETNQVKQLTKIDQAINKAIEIGFLRQLKTNEKRYEVCRIIKAFINADWLNQINTHLNDYYNYAKKYF